VSLSCAVWNRVLAIARAAAATVDETASCCAAILVADRGPGPTDTTESRTFSTPFNNDTLQRCYLAFGHLHIEYALL
jgi:hypothetical protein